MAKYAVHDIGGKRVTAVEFQSRPPDTDAIVYSPSGERIGSIKSQHAMGDGTVYDETGKVTGTLFGNPYADPFTFAVDDKGLTVGGVLNGSQVMLGPDPQKW